MGAIPDPSDDFQPQSTIRNAYDQPGSPGDGCARGVEAIQRRDLEREESESYFSRSIPVQRPRGFPRSTAHSVVLANHLCYDTEEKPVSVSDVFCESKQGREPAFSAAGLLVQPCDDDEDSAMRHAYDRDSVNVLPAHVLRQHLRVPKDNRFDIETAYKQVYETRRSRHTG